jgi:UDPglucose 6-dehydrogenase
VANKLDTLHGGRPQPNPEGYHSVRIGVIGSGHVGLTTAATLASLGHEAVAFDQDSEKIDQLKKGRPHFYEPGLEELMNENMAAGRLSFSDEPGPAIENAEVVFICVGTPPRATGEASLVAVEQAALAVAHHATGRIVVVEKSTVPAGTSERVTRIIEHLRPDLRDEVEVISNPEFLREGQAVEDSLHPDRILVGAHTDWALETMRRLYLPLTDAGVPFISTDIATAELSKHACNAFLALKISYANALARLCEKAGADIRAVTEVMGHDARISSAFLKPGLGYGGFCFPKDLAAFHTLASQLGYEFPLLKEVARINEEAVESALDKIRESVWNLEHKRIALLGLSFKPDTDDTRFSPALRLAKRLLHEGAHVAAYDPRAMANAKSEVPELEVVPDAYDAVSHAHCLVLCTEWEEFAELDLRKMRELMAYPVLIDARNFFDPQAVHDAGFLYYPTGRPPLKRT